jgi:hypothetical protein
MARCVILWSPAVVGQTPWSAADALVGPSEVSTVSTERVQGDPRKPGGLPHRKTLLLGRRTRPSTIWLISFAGQTPWSAADALVGLSEVGTVSTERVQGDPRRPGGLPYHG